MSKRARVLIAGGGIAGLSLAAALHRTDFDVELVERSTSWDGGGGGIAVQPNGMRVLQALGLGAAVEGAGAIVRRWLFRDQHGEVLCDSDLQAVWGAVGRFVGIERGRLHEALLCGAAAVPCRSGTWVTSLAQAERHVSVQLSDGACCEYDLVVGADGILSTVRRAALGDCSPVYSGQMAWRSLGSIGPHEIDSVQFWLGDGCFFGLCPVGGGRIYGFANVTEPRLRDAVEGRLDRLRKRFAGFGGMVQDYLASLGTDDQIHCGPIEWLELDRWHAGRVVLIGDAAHASAPMMGQGGSMAMEDAWVLGELLRSTATVEHAVDVFTARRRPRVDWVQRQSRAAGEMLDKPPAIRNVALRERGDRALHDRFRPLVAPP